MMPYVNPNLAILGPWLIGWAMSWDVAVLLWGPMFRHLRDR